MMSGGVLRTLALLNVSSSEPQTPQLGYPKQDFSVGGRRHGNIPPLELIPAWIVQRPHPLEPPGSHRQVEST